MLLEEVYQSQLKELILLMEEDERDIEGGLQGELLDQYRKLITLEKNRVLSELGDKFNVN